MLKSIRKRYLPVIVIFLLGVTALVTTVLITKLVKKDMIDPTITPKTSSVSNDKESDKPSVEPSESYQGEVTDVAGVFSIKVPNGWRASVSENPSFLAIMFARPNQLGSLTYSATAAPTVDRDGIPTWNGLTEHFFIIAPLASQAFKPDAHLEVSVQPFTFTDGVIGQNYYVVKHREEAQKWGGLQKDTEWQGRTYIYEKNGKRIEAHLALYPSTTISIPFYEDVIRTLHF